MKDVEQIKDLIKEHSFLIVNITKLQTDVYGNAVNDDNPATFANKCIQLKAMKVYEESLRARLENVGIYYTDGQYLNRVAVIAPDVFDDADGDQNAPASEEHEVTNENPTDE